jgi:hypothetical protein
VQDITKGGPDEKKDNIYDNDEEGFNTNKLGDNTKVKLLADDGKPLAVKDYVPNFRLEVGE